ncbi:protein SAWADEE HOMEODOMAIN HOMOLOG 2-like isoform X2 [Bidens hawaiensis]|uniref:protein SAWADEE HOMEODOMAIN HOMOLOG 2-like isoform X1 n=1 Tax=Bidens hawaiensis TaxID=980011 RepID=UPI00404B0F4E
MANPDGVDYNLDYRWKADDAWYTCAAILEHGSRLRIKFKDTVQSYFDEIYSVADFNTHREIEQFLSRFRTVSEPVEDNECSRVLEGMKICAIYRNKDEALYYDATVDAVQYVEHTPDKCICSYLLCWQHGPGEGTLTETSIEDMCFIVHGNIHPDIAEFANLVKQQLKGANSVQSQASFSVHVIFGII